MVNSHQIAILNNKRPGGFLESIKKLILNLNFMNEPTFTVDIRRIPLLGWQGYIGADTLMSNIASILDGSPVNLVIVNPSGSYNEDGETWSEYKIAAIHNRERGVIEGGHHRAFAHLLLAAHLPCRFPQSGDVLSLPVLKDHFYAPIRDLIICRECELEERVKRHYTELAEAQSG